MSLGVSAEPPVNAQSGSANRTPAFAAMALARCRSSSPLRVDTSTDSTPGINSVTFACSTSSPTPASRPTSIRGPIHSGPPRRSRYTGDTNPTSSRLASTPAACSTVIPAPTRISHHPTSDEASASPTSEPLAPAIAFRAPASDTSTATRPAASSVRGSVTPRYTRTCSLGRCAPVVASDETPVTSTASEAPMTIADVRPMIRLRALSPKGNSPSSPGQSTRFLPVPASLRQDRTRTSS